jgi:predicted RNA-binding Zn-ribbon protein involved in translation (DUF1610 family)
MKNARLDGNSEVCPHCGANLIHSEIPEKDREVFGGKKYFLRVIGIYDMDRDVTVSYQCPDCLAEDKRNW